MTDAQPGSLLSWADRFRGAMLGGAVGDALGAGVRNTSTAEIQQWFGPQGVVDYLPVYGRRGAVTDLTQLTVFTLEALLRAKAANPGGNGWLPTEFVFTNYLRWLHTQGVPWDYAMSAYLQSEPAPTSWLLERPELYSTRNPDGPAIALLGRMARRSPLGPDGRLRPPADVDGMADCAAWAAPAMVWSNVPESVYSTGAATANLFTSAPNSVSAAGLHSDVLAQLIRGVPLWDAVTASDRNRLGNAYQVREVPADVRRTVHAAMFVGQRGIRPSPSDIDIEFDTEEKPGELGIALAAVGSTRSFADAVRVAANHSADSAVTGALAGQLAGAIYGPSGIPAQWVAELELREVIEILCADASEAFAPPPPPQWAQRYVTNPRRVGGPRELAGGTPNTVEGIAEQTMVMPAITAEPAPDRSDAADTPPAGIPVRNVEPVPEPPRRGRTRHIGAPTFPAASATPAEPVSFEVTDPSSTGPIPVPRLRSAEAPVETTAVFPAMDASADPIAPERPEEPRAAFPAPAAEDLPQVGAFPTAAARVEPEGLPAARVEPAELPAAAPDAVGEFSQLASSVGAGIGGFPPAAAPVEPESEDFSEPATPVELETEGFLAAPVELEADGFPESAASVELEADGFPESAASVELEADGFPESAASVGPATERFLDSAAPVEPAVEGPSGSVEPESKAIPAPVESEREQPEAVAAAVEPERLAPEPEVEPQKAPIVVPDADDIAAESEFLEAVAAGDEAVAPESPAAPQEFAAEDAFPTSFADAPLDDVPEDWSAGPDTAASRPRPEAASQPILERGPVDLEPPARAPIDLEPADLEPADLEPADLEPAELEPAELDEVPDEDAADDDVEAAVDPEPLVAAELTGLAETEAAQSVQAETAEPALREAVELVAPEAAEPVSPEADEPVPGAAVESVVPDAAEPVLEEAVLPEAVEPESREAPEPVVPDAAGPDLTDAARSVPRAAEPVPGNVVEPDTAAPALPDAAEPPGDAVESAFPEPGAPEAADAAKAAVADVGDVHLAGALPGEGDEPEPSDVDEPEQAEAPEPAVDGTEPQLPERMPVVAPIVRGEHAKADRPDDSAPSLTERVLGCFLGGALGDALGADLEFITAEAITARFGPDGPSGLREAYGVHGAITDDTQMTLFTAEGLIRGSVANRMLGTEDPLPELQLAYQRWLHTQGVEWDAAAGLFLADYPAPDGWLIEVPGLFKTRAPGKAVFRALARFGDGYPAGSFTEQINDSKGCGGVMRAAPVALCSTDPAVVFRLAARAAALTHSHPAGYHSAGALAVIVQQALLGRSLDDGVWLALQVLETWEEHDETSAMLKAAVSLAEAGVPTPRQVAETLGGGWVGEEALAIAVCAALVGGDDVELALRIAVHHDGDSDSTGAICGNIVGALLGVGALPIDWLAELELRDVVEQMALDCVAEFGRGAFQPGQAAIEPPTDEDWNERYPVRPQWSGVPESALRAAEPVPQFPAPKPAPRRINGVVHSETFEGENK